MVHSLQGYLVEFTLKYGGTKYKDRLYKSILKRVALIHLYEVDKNYIEMQTYEVWTFQNECHIHIKCAGKQQLHTCQHGSDTRKSCLILTTQTLLYRTLSAFKKSYGLYFE